MEKKTMGQFIAALRKANGFTQQELADRLGVSNKAVSRWERDECAPDIMVIPALAELLGVTCDELLKGERILKTESLSNEGQSERKSPRVEKQVKALVNRTLSDFKNKIGISIAISVVGLICMFGISYGFYRPVIGFTVMLLFAAVAATVVVIAVNKMKANKTDNELLENADQGLMERYDNCLGNYSFWAYYTVISVVMLSLPLVLNLSDYYVDYVMTFESYILYLGPILLILILIFLAAQKPYIAWILDKQLVELEETGELEAAESDIAETKSKLKRMNTLQIGAIVIAGILLTVAPWFTKAGGDSPILIGLVIAGLSYLAANIIVFVVMIYKNKDLRKQLWLPGIRNILLIPSGFLCAGIHGVGWYNGEKYDFWNIEWFWLAMGWTILILVAFKLIDHFTKKRKKQRVG